MAFGPGFLFDPLKNLNKGLNMFGAPASPLSPPPAAGSPFSLLRADEPMAQGVGGSLLSKAGGEDIVPPPSSGPIGANLATSRGVTIGGSTPEQNRANSLYPDTPTAPPPLVGGAAPTTPSASPQYTPTPPVGGEAPLRAPYQNPGSTSAGIAAPPLAAAPADPPSTGSVGAPAAPGAVPTRQLGQQSALSKLGDVGKALSSAGGASAKQALAGHPPSGMSGDPAAGSRQGAAGLLQDVMKTALARPAGPVPGLPPGLLRRFQGG